MTGVKPTEQRGELRVILEVCHDDLGFLMNDLHSSTSHLSWNQIAKRLHITSFARATITAICVDLSLSPFIVIATARLYKTLAATTMETGVLAGSGVLV